MANRDTLFTIFAIFLLFPLTKYQHYILMEYPIGAANTALINQLKQNVILSTQDAADKALAELEAEINKRQNNN